MSFKTYCVNSEDTGASRLSDPLPVRFSGPTGLVALWCRGHKDALDRPWRVTPMEWLAMIVPPAAARTRWLVFEQDEDGRNCCSRLIMVSGIVGRKVDLMFTFEPLLVEHPAPNLSVRVPGDGRLWTEELALEGGPYNSDCTWRWTKPHLALGAAILGRPVVMAR